MWFFLAWISKSDTAKPTFSPMKPRKTRKQSKSADQVGRDLDIIAEIRGQRKPKELTIETFTPMETSYAQMVKGQSDGEQIADISTKDAVTYMSGNPAVQTVTGIILFAISKL